MSLTAPISIFLVAPLRLYRECLARMLHEEPLVTLVGAGDHPDQLIGAVEEAQPDVLLLDSAVPEAARAVCILRAVTPETRVVALGVPEHGQDVIAWAEAGADGYVPPDASVADFIATIRAVAVGELRCSPAVAAALIRRVSALAGNGATTPDVVLTPRELQILKLVERGMSNKEIAEGLSIKLSTVKNHMHNLLEKLHARGRGEAAALLRGPDGANPR